MSCAKGARSGLKRIPGGTAGGVNIRPNSNTAQMFSDIRDVGSVSDLKSLGKTAVHDGI